MALATQDRGSPDGTFNGGPVYLQTKPLSAIRSSAHCVGETYQRKSAWKRRSCRFEFLCYNSTSSDFVVFESPDDRALARLLLQREFMHVSTSLHRNNASNAVSIGGINPKWGKEGIRRLKWFPNIVPLRQKDHSQLTYYELPESTVLLPFHSLNGANPGHLVWDDFLPIYTLLKMFRLEDSVDLLPMRYVLQDGERGLWASCDSRKDKREECRHMMQKFGPLLVGLDSIYNFTTTVDAALVENVPGRAHLVCAKTGLAGLGPLTDHGLSKGHGWEEVDYRTVHNSGRGGALYDFRNFMLQNIQIDPETAALEKPYRIVFSQKSSDIKVRSMDFERQIALVKAHFPDASVENYIFKEMPIQEQLNIATNTAIYITLCGGGAVTAMFLPAGASVILYYAEDGGIFNGRLNNKPATLDWDLFNAMSHLRVHWMPRHSMKSATDEQALVELIRHELKLTQSQVFL